MPDRHPRARGPISGSVLDALRWGVLHRAMDLRTTQDRPLDDDDLHLALHALRTADPATVAAVDGLDELGRLLAERFVRALRGEAVAAGPPTNEDVVGALEDAVAAWTGGPTPIRFLDDPERRREVLCHLSACLDGAVPAASVDRLPTVTLATGNALGLLHGAADLGRRAVEALAPSRSLRCWAAAAGRPDDRHVIDPLRACARLVAEDPLLVHDVLFGAHVALASQDRLAHHLVGSWRAGLSSLRVPRPASAGATSDRAVRSA